MEIAKHNLPKKHSVFLDQSLVHLPVLLVKLVEQRHEKPMATTALKLLDQILVQRDRRLVLGRPHA